MNKNKALAAAAIMTAALGIPAVASAQAVQVIGDGFGESCWRAAVA